MALEPVNVRQMPAAPQPNTLVLSDGYETFTPTALSGTSATAVYTAATAAQRRITRVNKLVITNDTAAGVTITVTVSIGGITDYTYYSSTSLAARGQLVFDDMGMILSASDVLKVTGDTGVDVFVSAREFQGNRT